MTNQQTETKPFRSLADEYRENGLCELCGGTRYGKCNEFVFCNPCGGISHAVNLKTLAKNRSTPAQPETGGAKPVFAPGMLATIVRNPTPATQIGQVVTLRDPFTSNHLPEKTGPCWTIGDGGLWIAEASIEPIGYKPFDFGPL